MQQDDQMRYKMKRIVDTSRLNLFTQKQKECFNICLQGASRKTAHSTIDNKYGNASSKYAVLADIKIQKMHKGLLKFDPHGKQSRVHGECLM